MPPDDSVLRIDGPWSHRVVSAGGARFHVVEAGEGPLVLLLHGFPEFWWAWRYQLPALAHAGYRAVAMDLRGYGLSDKPPRGYDPYTLANDVSGVVRALGEASGIVVGHGWGGFLAWTTAVVHPDSLEALCAVSMPHPRRLREAVTTEPRQIAASKYTVAFQRPLLAERSILKDDAAYIGELLDRWSAPGWPDEQTAKVYRTAMQVSGVAHSALEYHRWLMRSLPRPDGLRFAARMKQPVSVPVLHIQGELDTAVLPKSSEGSDRYVAGPYTRRVIQGVGHFPHEEAPNEFTAELLDWLAKTTG